MSSKEEIEFLLSLQLFTIHCVSKQSSSKIESYCQRLVSSVENLDPIYIGHKIQLALSLESASLRNQSNSKLNNQMKLISHLIALCRPKIGSNEEVLCQQWANIDLNRTIDSIEQRFQEQSHSTTLWLQLTNEQSLISIHSNSFNRISFEYVQHDTDIEQLFQWIHQNQIEINGRLNRSYTGVPLFWITPFQSSSNQSKYGSIRLVFPYSTVYSNDNDHHLFDLGTRKNPPHIWNNILITKRKQVAAYGFPIHEISPCFLSPVDIAIDLTDGPLLIRNVEIVFVNHTDECIRLLPSKLTREHSCYHTSQSAMKSFLQYLNNQTQLQLGQLEHLFNQHTFQQLTQMQMST